MWKVSCYVHIVTYYYRKMKVNKSGNISNTAAAPQPFMAATASSPLSALRADMKTDLARREHRLKSTFDSSCSGLARKVAPSLCGQCFGSFQTHA